MFSHKFFFLAEYTHTHTLNRHKEQKKRRSRKTLITKLKQQE